jgi:hypothetical protein
LKLQTLYSPAHLKWSRLYWINDLSSSDHCYVDNKIGCIEVMVVI